MRLKAGDKVFFPRNYDGKYRICSGTIIGKGEGEKDYWKISIPTEICGRDWRGEFTSIEALYIKRRFIFRTVLEAMDKSTDLLKQDYADAHKKMLDDMENFFEVTPDNQKQCLCGKEHPNPDADAHIRPERPDDYDICDCVMQFIEKKYQKDPSLDKQRMLEGFREEPYADRRVGLVLYLMGFPEVWPSSQEVISRELSLNQGDYIFFIYKYFGKHYRIFQGVLLQKQPQDGRFWQIEMIPRIDKDSHILSMNIKYDFIFKTYDEAYIVAEKLIKKDVIREISRINEDYECQKSDAIQLVNEVANIQLQQLKDYKAHIQPQEISK